MKLTSSSTKAGVRSSARNTTPCTHPRSGRVTLPTVHIVHKTTAVIRGNVSSAAAVSSEGPQTSTPPTKGGRATYKPSSFAEIVADAMRSVTVAMANGNNRLEVEFPPLPGRVDAYKGASDTYVDSNAQLAIAAAKLLSKTEGKKVHVVFPDLGEYTRAYKMFKSGLEFAKDVSLGHAREVQDANSPLRGLASFMIGNAPDPTAAAAAADIFFVINVTTTEIPGVEEYINNVVKDRAVCLFNLELDTLRGDLGLPAFPSKEVQYRFLSTFLPAYYLRTRDYCKTVPIAPFVVNYSGCMLREYPGPWQVMIKQDNSVYACIAEDPMRYTLGEVKDELAASMGLNTEAEGSVEQFLRRGYKTSTWYEDDYELEKSHNWRI